MREKSPPSSASLLDDQPSATDLLNFGQFAGALTEVILNPQTKTPFSIGIFGRWGTGKTTLMRMLERDLDQKSVTTVWFSAWLYNQEQEIWAAFLQSLIRRLAARLPLRDQARFSAGIFRSGFTWEKLLYEAPRLLWKVLIVTLPVLFASIFASSIASHAGALLLQSSGIITSTLLGAWYFLRPAVRAAHTSLTPDFSLYRSLDFESHIGFLDRFRDQFSRIVAALPNKNSRVVVFVDDLDRCSSDKALHLLDAIKVFLDVPECFFVLGLDLAVIQSALATKYPNDRIAQKEYLDKVIQLPFQLPPLTALDLENYLRALDVVFPDDRCREVFLASLSRNPREIKRVINTFALHWYLAQARVSDNAVTPVRLAKVIVIQQAFGPLFLLLREQPHLLSLLERALRGEQNASSDTQPVDTSIDTSTVVLSPEGIALPPALTPFQAEPALIRLLTMHSSTTAGAGDDANFATLPPEEIAVYFTLTRRTTVARADAHESVRRARGSGPPEDLPDFAGYTILQRLGQGGVSQIYLAEQRAAGRKVAIKCLLGTLTSDPHWIARFEREAQVMRSLPPHPNLTAILDAGTGKDADARPLPFYAMEFVNGETLGVVLARAGRLDLRTTHRYITPVFDALQHLHGARLVHRDLKPANILIGADGVPRLTDFTLAFRPVEGRDDLTSTGYVLGTPAYMSPEQLLGKSVDGRSDLFALGLIIFECLTGKNPVIADTPSATLKRILSEDMPSPTDLEPQLPPAIDQFMARILARDVSARFQSAGEARAAFERAIGVDTQPNVAVT
jgi:hypothetical protein